MPEFQVEVDESSLRFVFSFFVNLMSSSFIYLFFFTHSLTSLSAQDLPLCFKYFPPFTHSTLSSHTCSTVREGGHVRAVRPGHFPLCESQSVRDIWRMLSSLQLRLSFYLSLSCITATDSPNTYIYIYFFFATTA